MARVIRAKQVNKFEKELHMQSTNPTKNSKSTKRALNNSDNNDDSGENPPKIQVTFSKVKVKPLLGSGGLSTKQTALLRRLNGEINSKPKIVTRNVNKNEETKK